MQTGGGMPTSRQQLDPARTAGTHGLDLSIVKAIADAHDASIIAEPRPDGGLTVQAGFPWREAH
jgi:signal transduction histidine kinase